MFFFKNHAENEAGRLVSHLYLFLKKALRKVKAISLHLSFNTSIGPRLGHTMKTNFIER